MRSAPLRRTFASLLVLAAIAVPVQAIEVSDLARPSGGLLDRTGRVNHESTAEFRRIAEHVRRETGGEIAAIVVASLEGKDPSRFARELSEAWHLGGNDAKGLLLLVSLQDRQIELTLGRGLDDLERRERAAQIVQDTLAPRLRAGDVDGALIAAARESATRIFYAVEVIEPEAEEAIAAGSASEPASVPPRKWVPPTGRSLAWVPYAIGLAILLIGLAIYGSMRSEKS